MRYTLGSKYIPILFVIPWIVNPSCETSQGLGCPVYQTSCFGSHLSDYSVRSLPDLRSCMPDNHSLNINSPV